MKFYNRYEELKYSQLNEYTGELTTELDKISSLGSKYYKHYIILDDLFLRSREIPVRVPGCTVGCISVDENMIITRIYIDTNRIIKTYASNVNERMKKFVGEVIEY